jgi:hypothetical protein
MEVKMFRKAVTAQCGAGTKMVNDAFTSSFAQGSIMYKNVWVNVNTDDI